MPVPTEAIAHQAYAIRRATRAALFVEPRVLQRGRVPTTVPKPPMRSSDAIVPVTRGVALLLTV